MTNRFEMMRGDSRDQPFRIRYRSGTSVDLTSTQIIFTVKKTEKDATALFQCKNTLAGGNETQIEMTTPLEGRFVVHISATNSGLAVGGENYWYDVQLTIGGKVYTPVKDRVLFKQDITT
jgi:hypothetical protein